MREKFEKIPPPLQKQIIMRCGAALVSLLLMVVSLLLEGNLYLSLSVLLFFAFYGFSALQLLYKAVTDQIVVIRGHCTGLEKTPMRRRIKTLYLWSDPHIVKIQIWESTDMGNPYNSIKNVVYRLRKTLACIGLRDLIQASHGTFTLNPNYTIFTDVERFDDACKRIDNSSDPAILQALYESIIGLYRGSLLPRYDFYHWLMPKTLYYQNKFLHYMKRYLSMLYREKNYLRVQELSMDLLSIDMYESEVHYHLIKAMLMSGSKTLSQIYFRQAEPYLTDEHMQELKTFFT